MILISLLPLPSRKLVSFFGVTMFLSCISCFGHSAFFVVKSTPYDNQMTRIRPILETAASTSRSADLSLRLVNHWIESLRAIPYSFSQQWRTPSEVETATTADCKGKAVTLYEKMRRSGISNVRLVIGRRSHRAAPRTLGWSGRHQMPTTFSIPQSIGLHSDQMTFRRKITFHSTPIPGVISFAQHQQWYLLPGID